MGATFRNASGKRQTWRKEEEFIFGIHYAIRMNTQAPREANFNKPNADNVQLTIASYEGQDIMLQFRLSRQDNLLIAAYDPNSRMAGKVIVNSENPSIDAIINNKYASPDIKYEATKVKNIIDKAYAGVRQDSIIKLAEYLKRRKRL